jgi:regulator of sigma E protease
MLESLLTVWTVIYTVFAALFLFGVTVFVHEFGHFLAARRCGLVVKTFSIGFGHAVVQWERNGIRYKVGWIPFGGYVSLPQLDPEGMERIQGDASAEKYPEISPWKKIIVAVAGPFGNILLALALAIAIWLIPGGDAGVQIRPIIGNIETNCAAYAAGLRQGDEILAVNGTAIRNWYDFSVESLLKDSDIVALDLRNAGAVRHLDIPVVKGKDGLRNIEGVDAASPCLFGSVNKGGPADRAGIKSGDVALQFNDIAIIDWNHFTELVQAAEPGVPVALTVSRKGKPLTLSIVPEHNEAYDRVMIGVRPGAGFPWMFYKNPVDQIKYDALAMVRVLKALVTPAEAKQAAGELGGPIQIFTILAAVIKMGALNTFGLIRHLNINLAVLNLMPIPVLDGGHVVFALWHGITRRKVNVRVQTILINFFAVLLIGAMLLISLRDVDRNWHVRDFFAKFLGRTEAVQSAPDEGE